MYLLRCLIGWIKLPPHTKRSNSRPCVRPTCSPWRTSNSPKHSFAAKSPAGVCERGCVCLFPCCPVIKWPLASADPVALSSGIENRWTVELGWPSGGIQVGEEWTRCHSILHPQTCFAAAWDKEQHCSLYKTTTNCWPGHLVRSQITHPSL